MNTKLTRAAAAVGGLAITAAFAVSCAETKDAAKDMASSAASVGSSAASAAGSSSAWRMKRSSARPDLAMPSATYRFDGKTSCSSTITRRGAERLPPWRRCDR